MHSWCYLFTKPTAIPRNLYQQIGFCSMAALAGTHQVKARLRYYSLNTQYTNSWTTYTLGKQREENLDYVPYNS